MSRHDPLDGAISTTDMERFTREARRERAEVVAALFARLASGFRNLTRAGSSPTADTKTKSLAPAPMAVHGR